MKVYNIHIIGRLYLSMVHGRLYLYLARVITRPVLDGEYRIVEE